MILKSLTVQNFGPYRGTCGVNLAPTSDDGDRPICLIGALNGSGKTSLLDALLLALYGTRARCSTRGDQSWKEFLSRARNAHAPRSERSLVELVFDYPTAEGTTRYRISRSWWPQTSGMSESLKVFVTPPGGRESEDPELEESWGERVEDLIPQGVSNLFFFDGEQVRALAISEETTPEIRSAIRTLLGLELADRLARDLAIIASRKRKDLANEAELQEAENIEQRLAAKKEEVEVMLRARAEVQEALESAKRRYATLRDHFVVTGGALAERRAEHEQQLGRAQARVESARESLVELAAGPLPLILARPLLEKTVRRARQEVQHLESQDHADDLEARDRATLDMLQRLGVGPGQLNDLFRFLHEDRRERLKPLDGEPYLHLHRNAVVTMEHLLKQELPQQWGVAERTLGDLVRARKEVGRLQGQLSAAAAPEEVAAQVRALEQAEGQVRDYERQHGRVAERADIAAAERDRLQSDLDRRLRALADGREAAGANRRMLNAAERVQSVLTHYQNRLKARKLARLEELITERFQHLIRKEDFVQRIEIDAETFRLSLYGEGRREIDKARLSAGEQQILAVAFLWALSMASGRNLPVVIDTPLSRMDSVHRQSLVERYFPHASHQVVLLSTDTEIDQGYFERLKALDVLDRRYHLEFDPVNKTSRVHPGYFWE